ncbi:MAG: peptidylprolyl isomerase [Nannocystaceae bacterium]
MQAALLAATCALACVFTLPPPLPEELAAEQEAEAARIAALRSGEGEESEGGGGEAGAGGSQAGGESPEAEVDPTKFKAGEIARVGMSPAEIRAYNTAQGDPERGEFTLEEALVGVEGGGPLFAEIVTTRGVIRCELFARDAPLTVANFVGLARGLRPFLDRDQGAWVKRPYYDGVTFHRVIPGFMIQAGDPSGTGTGNPGYVIQDEIVPTYSHDDAGVLSMANRGSGTGGGQFFITLGPTLHLDGKHTIFGRCDPEGMEIADDIALVPRDANDRPSEPEEIETIRITR